MVRCRDVPAHSARTKCWQRPAPRQMARMATNFCLNTRLAFVGVSYELVLFAVWVLLGFLIFKFTGKIQQAVSLPAVSIGQYVTSNPADRLYSQMSCSPLMKCN